jgi:hypothetical protein
MGKTTPNRITVEVTEADIARARVNDSYKCVVSQAIARTVPTATYIETDTQAIRFTVDGERRAYLTPYAVQGYVVAFDAGEEIVPFSFRIDRPQLTRRKTRSAVGKQAAAAAGRARRAATKERVATPEHVATKPRKPKTANPREAARAAYASVKSAYPDQPMHESESGRGLRTAPPRVFRKRQRSYGHRLLRINQEPVE